LFADISSEMLYPILPIFLTQVLHASGSVVGVVEGIAEATERIDAIVEMKQPGVWILGSTSGRERQQGMGVVVE
jgi:hypothetical protein